MLRQKAGDRNVAALFLWKGIAILRFEGDVLFANAKKRLGIAREDG
jgi:hypothetical protein